MKKSGYVWAMRGRWKLERMTGLGVYVAFGIVGMGCQNESAIPVAPGANQEVRGKVLLAGGKPLTKARIVLIPKQQGGLPLYGTLGADGGYTLKAGGLAVGVSHGEFLVSVEPNGYVAGSTVKPKGLLFPAKYLNPENGLTVTINAETRELPPMELK